MKRLTDRNVLELLRHATPAVEGASGPRTDLWPSVRRRIDQRSSPTPTADWVLAVALGLACLLRPSLVELVLLHF